MKAKPNYTDLLSQFQKGDLRALGKLISLAENLDPAVYEVLEKTFKPSKQSKVFGVTGVPGAGKSSLLSGFIRCIREQNQKVAVVAVDPVSPFSGGSILGDRIRLTSHFNDPEVYIRSLSTRGRLGGISLATEQAVHLLMAFGFDWILVETVGVGQSEVDIRNIADLTTVVLVPEWGDSIQALKSGIIEIGDLFIVNKADREGAQKIVSELENTLQLSGRSDIKVLPTTALEPLQVAEVFKAIQDLFEEKTSFIEGKRKNRTLGTAREVIKLYLDQELETWITGEQSLQQNPNPYLSIQSFLKKYPAGSLFKK